MRPSSETTYNQITREKWQRIQRHATTYGIVLPADQGRAKSFGATIDWNYQEKQQSLNVTLVDPGFFSPAEAIAFLNNLVAQA